MLGVETICSDESCGHLAEAVVASVGELDVLVCDDCGCLVQALAVWEVVEVRPRVAARLDLSPALPLAA